MNKIIERFRKKTVEQKKKYNILLLTNRDSDNVGDQVIEASDIALIKAAMKNLNITEANYEINSRAASIISKKYVSTRNEKLLKTAEKQIENSDMVIFGGAPMFNYQYQIFYERTATILEIAERYHKPVIFSAIGIERYDETNEKCQRLKKTLNFDCVKQITTRDGIEELKKYKTKEQLVIDIVADPAVFSAQAFKNHVVSKQNDKKKIGIFVFRANGFKDNKIDFSKDDAVGLWKNIIFELERKGYDYSLLTSGHFGDEAFMDYLIREHGIKEKKCIFNMNSPEKLAREISSFDAIISCRLHPSIIAFSMGVPSIGLIWNPKVRHFYDCIGYSDRRIDVVGIEAKDIVAKVEEAIAQGVTKNGEYLMTVYRYLFKGIQKSLDLDGEDVQSYEYDELIQNIPAYSGTNQKDYEEKLKRKFRRIYETLNTRAEINADLKGEIQELKEEPRQFEMFYHSGEKGEHIVPVENWEAKVNGNINRLKSQALECKLPDKVKNDESEIFADCPYQNGDKQFCGWRLRFKIGQTWFWYLEDATFCAKDKYDGKKNKKVKRFLSGETIPNLLVPGIVVVVAEAQWKKQY